MAARLDERDAGAVAAALTRRWVRGYTAWVGAEAAERRRAEIASDVWEQRTDAHERRVAPVTVALAIAVRVVAGMPADLTWVHTQRLAMRGLPADRKAQTMNTLGSVVARWWWVLGATVLAGLGASALLLGDSDVNRPQVAIVVAALVAGIALRRSRPRTAGSLVVVGAAVPAVLFWAPAVMVLGIVTLVGAAIEVVGLTRGSLGRALAAVGLVALAASWLWTGALGLAGPSMMPGVLAPVVFAAGGIALLIATGSRRGTVATA